MVVMVVMGQEGAQNPRAIILVIAVVQIPPTAVVVMVMMMMMVVVRYVLRLYQLGRGRLGVCEPQPLDGVRYGREQFGI
jgi:hypothetical protein